MKTIEVADDEDEVTTPSRLRQRNVRNLTQDPPASVGFFFLKSCKNERNN